MDNNNGKIKCKKFWLSFKKSSSKDVYNVIEASNHKDEALGESYCNDAQPRRAQCIYRSLKKKFSLCKLKKVTPSDIKKCQEGLDSFVYNDQESMQIVPFVQENTSPPVPPRRQFHEEGQYIGINEIHDSITLGSCTNNGSSILNNICDTQESNNVSTISNYH